jgi:hypothetical protein
MIEPVFRIPAAATALVIISSAGTVNIKTRSKSDGNEIDASSAGRFFHCGRTDPYCTTSSARSEELTCGRSARGQPERPFEAVRAVC